MAQVDVTDREAYNALLARFPKDNLGPLTHFYRGELGRSNVWRQKMDMTTNWAIVSSTAIISVAFSRADVTHLMIPFGVLIVFLLLNIEGRRYRFFDVWRTRVRMLEVHFLVPALIHAKPLPEGNWREVLCEDLFAPAFRISYFESIGRRLYRNYSWIFLILLAAWISKVLLHPGQDAEGNPLSTYQSFGEAGIPPWVLFGFMGLLYGFLAGVMIATIHVRHATGEVRRKDPTQKSWPI